MGSGSGVKQGASGGREITSERRSDRRKMNFRNESSLQIK